MAVSIKENAPMELAKTTLPEQRKAHIIGGITDDYGALTNSRSLEITQRIGELGQIFWNGMDVRVHDMSREVHGNTDRELRELSEQVAGAIATKMVFWLPASSNYDDYARTFRQKSINDMTPRKDIFLVGMTPTVGMNGQEQYNEALRFVKESSANLSLAYDYESGNAMVVAPEEAHYHESTELDVTVRGLMEMAYLRSQLTFTRSTVVGGEPVEWDSEEVYPSLRDVVNFCIENGAYKPFLGVTAGHFAAKVGENEFLTSRRKTNFNNLSSTGLVRVVTDGPDSVVAFGGKPSVGGQSQRIVFSEHPERDSIVHFHCPIKEGSNVPVVSQREYECGSHECGKNTSDGLAVVDDGIEAVYLDNHGPNVVFHHDENPKKIQEFLMDNFDFTKKTGGYQLSGVNS